MTHIILSIAQNNFQKSRNSNRGERRGQELRRFLYLNLVGPGHGSRRLHQVKLRNQKKLKLWKVDWPKVQINRHIPNWNWEPCRFQKKKFSIIGGPKFLRFPRLVKKWRNRGRARRRWAKKFQRSELGAKKPPFSGSLRQMLKFRRQEFEFFRSLRPEGPKLRKICSKLLIKFRPSPRKL